jgi:hypothetical protein
MSNLTFDELKKILSFIFNRMLLAKLKNGQSRIVPKKSGLHCRTTITTDLMMRKADEFLSGFQQILDVLQNWLLLSRIYSFLFVVTDTALKIFSGWSNQVWRYYNKIVKLFSVKLPRPLLQII